MTKQAGSLTRGQRPRDEVPEVPVESALSSRGRAAQAALATLVEAAGGRYGTGSPIAVADVGLLADLFDEWARGHAERRDGQLYFNGHPGLWHALDGLYPLQDPNRWDRLRAAVIVELEQ